MREFICFSTTDVFVPVSQLSTRDLFYFLKTLKLGKTFLSWVSRLVRPFEQRALWFPYSRFFFGNSVQESVNSWVFGVFIKSIVVSILDFFDTSLFRKMFYLLTCKRNHNWPFFDQLIRMAFWGVMFIDSWLNHPLGAMFFDW